MDRVATIRKKLEQALSPEYLEIVDESHLHVGHAGAASGAGHFNVTVVSGIFKDQNLISRHRLVYQAVDDLMQSEIHALSIKAMTPEEHLSTGD